MEDKKNVQVEGQQEEKKLTRKEKREQKRKEEYERKQKLSYEEAKAEKAAKRRKLITLATGFVGAIGAGYAAGRNATKRYYENSNAQATFPEPNGENVTVTPQIEEAMSEEWKPAPTAYTVDTNDEVVRLN